MEPSLPRIVLVSALLAAAPIAQAAHHSLKAVPQNIAWGYYWASAKPVLTVRSGDTVEIQTVSGDPEQLERAGVKSE